MIFASGEKDGRRAQVDGATARRKLTALLSIALLLSALAMSGAGCATATCGSSISSSTFGQYHQGRTLHVSVVSLERAPELRYSTIDPNQVIRRWSLSPSTPGAELILARLKVENHTAVSAIINIDRSAVELRDFANDTYRPVPVSENVWQDFRGETEALTRVDQGQCFDGGRALIDPGTTVRWESEAESDQYIAFRDPAVPLTGGDEGRAELIPGAFLTHTFDQPGDYPYECGADEDAQWPAQIRVAAPADATCGVERTVHFLNGSFELQQGHGLNGYVIFEAPVGTEFRDMRWRAGDSITIRF